LEDCFTGLYRDKKVVGVFVRFRAASVVISPLKTTILHFLWAVFPSSNQLWKVDA
jgi:hypothetical protein